MKLFDDFSARENVVVGLPGFRARPKEEGFGCRAEGASPTGQFEAVHPGHVDVCDQDFDLGIVPQHAEWRPRRPRPPN